MGAEVYLLKKEAAGLAPSISRGFRQVGRAISPVTRPAVRAAASGAGSYALADAAGASDAQKMQWAALGAGVGGLGAGRGLYMSKPKGWAGRAVGAATALPAAGLAALPAGGGQLKPWVEAAGQVPGMVQDSRQLLTQAKTDYQKIVPQIQQTADQAQAAVKDVQQGVNQVKSYLPSGEGGGWNPLSWMSQMNPTQQGLLGGGALLALLPLLGGWGGQQQPGLGNTLGPLLSMGLLAHFYPQLASQFGLPSDPVSQVMNYARESGAPATPSAPQATPSASTPSP